MIFSWQIVKGLFGVPKTGTLEEPAFSYTGIVDLVVQEFPACSTTFERQKFVIEASTLLATLDVECAANGKLNEFSALVNGFYGAIEAAEGYGDKCLALLEDLIFAAAALCNNDAALWAENYRMFDRWRSYVTD